VANSLALAIRTIALGAAVSLPVAANAASLTLFHNNDGESKIFGDGNFTATGYVDSGFGGVAYFKTTLDNLRAANAGRDQLTISSGDNVLAGLAYNASLATGPLGSRTYYDAIALNLIGYDAITLGNHDFDSGPAVLADFVSFYNAQGGSAPFLSANLDFSGESSLQSLVTSGSIAKSTVVTKNGNTYGIIGVTTETLPTVSQPGAVGVNPVLPAIQQEVALLQSLGVNKIILSSHLQNLNNELSLVGQLSGVDIVIAGGGDELLINADNARNNLSQRAGPYPVTVQDADGKNVAVVTTVGEYFYVGKLDVEFDANGDVVSVSGEPVVVDKDLPGADTGVLPDPVMQAQVVTPVVAAVTAANSSQIATTEVFLEHSSPGTSGPRVIRQRETNLGNLIADAFVWAAGNEAGVNPGNALIGLTNSGGIREDLDNDANGVVTQGEAFATLPFNNTLAVVENLDVVTLVTALENAVSRIQPNLTGTDGRFAQISGFEFDYNPQLAAGSRVVQVRFADGSLIWDAALGAVYAGLFDLATNSFLAGAGTPDGYNFGSAVRTILGVGYAESLINFIQQELNGQITAADYAITGEGRINVVPVPAAVWLFGGALAGLAGLRRRSQAQPA
jgi:5'-nucleotidase / UDP-sugar diphosphatase